MPIGQTDLASTVKVLTEGMKADITKQSNIRNTMRKIVSKSLFIPEAEKKYYLHSVMIFEEAILWDMKDVFIRQNLRYLKQLVDKKIIEKQAVDDVVNFKKAI